MAETKAAPAATKKTAAKSTTAKKATTTKKKTTAATTKVEKITERKFSPTDMIVCKSVRQNGLVYVSPSTGITYVWNGFGSINELPYQEIMSMKASKSRFLYDPWILIEEKDILERADFKKDFESMYALYEEFEDPETFFSQSLDVIEEKIANIPNGLRDLIVYNAGTYIEDGTLDRMSVVNTLDQAFGTNLKMLMM